MGRVRYWQFTCEHCGKIEDFKSLYLPRLMGWVHVKEDMHVKDYCSDKCKGESDAK